MTERRKLFLVCGVTSILILLFGICFSKNAGEIYGRGVYIGRSLQ
ncbi:Uncharacterised protein [uncultured Eubacterium sp.]|nr:Uncharacterised protein [uncultured Eubacterium sp.]